MLDGDPFAQSRELKRPRLLAELSELTRFHRAGSASYARMIDTVFGCRARYDDLESLPWLPVQLFKRHELKTVPDEKVLRVLVSSGTTGAAPSRVFLDKETARAQTVALARIVGHFIGPQRLPMVIVDAPAAPSERTQFSARSAATLGFATMGRDHFYALNSELEPNWAALEQYLQNHAGHPVMVFGFTFMVWQLLETAAAAGIKLHFPGGSVLIHGGGWKRLQDRKVSNETFKEALRATFEIERVHNYYGMVEQVGAVYFECESGWLHAPAYSDVITRDPMRLHPLPFGEQGLLQVLSVLPRSYPGHSLLSEDLGTIAGEDDCTCGRMGKRFLVSGRLPRAELRGCSDTRTSHHNDRDGLLD